MASVVPGTATTYTIVVTNNGPSNVTGATVTDVMPAAIASDTFTAVATGGATGFTASGSGNINDTVNLPAGSTITYTVVANVGVERDRQRWSNTATVAVPPGRDRSNARQQQRDRHGHADAAGNAASRQRTTAA